MLRQSMAAGALVLAPGLACGSDDADVFASATGDATDGSTTTPATTTPSTNETAPTSETTAATETTNTTQAPGDSAASGDASAFPAGAEMVIAFTYQQAAGGKDLPPYLAVWIEDAGGELVDTIALWYLQGRKGTRWLPDLRRWFNVDQSRIDAGGADTVDVVSSATRLPGSYSVVWDGTTDTGPAPIGDYHICIEAVRERGPYSLIREPLTLDGSSVNLELPDEGELVAASVALDV